MPDIDIDKIKPGDTVRVSYQNVAMGEAGAAPVEFEGAVYQDCFGLRVGQSLIDSDNLTILEHTPALPDWADALVVRDKDGLLHLADADRGGFNCQNGAHWPVADMRSLEPITVVIDADGNPPTPEPEWLDADALNDLPDDSLVLPRAENRPRVRHLGGWYRVPGGVGHLPRAIAPARVLWVPHA